MKLYAIALLGISMLVSQVSYARVWGEWIAGGTSCNAGNISVIENGDDLAVLFDSFGVNMPASSTGDGLSTRKTCNFRISLTPPKGFYLANFRQVYSGGLIKTRHSSAQLNIQYRIGSILGKPLPIIWPAYQQVLPSDPGSLFNKIYDNPLLVASCGGSTVYGINMSFSAARPNYSTSVVGGLDSVDASFVQKLVLIPEWRLCP